MSYPVVQVTWRDAATIEEVTDDLPTVTDIVSVGWMASEDENCLVLVRDHHPDPDAYTWRASVAIPKAVIIERHELEVKADAT